jgi:hypothetical protein
MPIDQQQANGKTKKNNTFVLLRPVICICNDLYVIVRLFDSTIDLCHTIEILDTRLH